MLRTTVKQILGTPNGSGWSQVYHYWPSEKEKQDQRGELVLLVSLGNIKGDEEGAALGREMISRFHEEYYGSLEGKPGDVLEDILGKIGQEKSQYFEIPDDINLIALVLWKDIVYLGTWHGGKILLRRKGETATMVEGQKKQSVVASGRAEEEDLFLLATEDFIENIPEGMVGASLSTEDLETIIETLGPVVYSREKQGRLAAAFIRLETKVTEEVQPEKVVSSRKISLPQIDLRKIVRFLPSKKILQRVFLKVKERVSGLFVAIAFLVLLLVSVFFGWRKRAEQQKIARIGVLTEEISEKVTAAEKIRNLDPESSLELIKETDLSLEELGKLNQEKYQELKSKIESVKNGLGGEVIDPEVYYHLNLVADNAQATSVYTNGKEAIVLDQPGKRLLQLDLEDKSGEIIAGGEELGSQKLVVFSNQRVYLVGEKTISWLNSENEIEEIQELENGEEVVAADGWLGSLYLFDKKNNQFWKCSAVSSGLGKPQAWFRSDPPFQSDSIIDVGINGNVWFLDNQGNIYKYLSGSKVDFNYEVSSSVGRTTRLAVAQDEERIAFWDEEKKTVWVFTKDGQFVSRNPLKIDGLVNLGLSPDGQTVFLFGKEKIYSLSLD